MQANGGIKVNREYKDRLFRMIFGAEEKFFRTHKEGVIDVSLTEYNEAEFIENRREEGRKEGEKEGLAKGKKEGLAKGKLELIANMLQNGYSYEQISTMINMTVNEMKELEEQVMVK